MSKDNKTAVTKIYLKHKRRKSNVPNPISERSEGVGRFNVRNAGGKSRLKSGRVGILEAI